MPRYCIRKAKLAKEATTKKPKEEPMFAIQENPSFRGFFAFLIIQKIKKMVHGRAKAEKVVLRILPTRNRNKKEKLKLFF